MTFLIELDDNYNLKKVTPGFSYELHISKAHFERIISSGCSCNGINPLYVFLIYLATISIFITVYVCYRCYKKIRSTTDNQEAAPNQNIAQLNNRQDQFEIVS